MAGYIAHYTKKKDRLVRKVRDLRRLLERGATREKLLKEALEVRDCKIRVLKAKQANNSRHTAEARRGYLKLDSEIEALQSLTAEMVLDEFPRF